MSALEVELAGASVEVRGPLTRALEGRALTWREAVTLMAARGRDFRALCLVADELRQRQVGDTVTYVVNRNINFTNVCVKSCRFCAFARGARSEEGYFLQVEDVVNRALEAQRLGATEVCLQAGLAPNLDGDTYVQLCRAVKRAAPDLHLHAFSPEEVKYAAGLSRVSIQEYLTRLREAGLDSMPGTSAEILDDDLRQRIAPRRITVAEWIDVVRSAHALGIPTTATMMFGHVETLEHRARHLELLRTLQQESGGFTEFVPLAFVHRDAPLFVRAEIPGVQPGPTGHDVVALYAVSRLMLGETFRNIQASWVKEGLRQAQLLLDAGVNDLGGTLINESISTAAGAGHGQFLAPSALRRAIRDAARTPAQRSTRYDLLRTFARHAPADGEPPEPLDLVDEPDATFGSYAALTQDGRFRFQRRSASGARNGALEPR
ncbi:MAG: 5-amino-6-(D-ribitylamino)uracil--L-tyrosine 4-hydroxyphenyl transferase CofH [Kofleriaceae bacterium]